MGGNVAKYNSWNRLNERISGGACNDGGLGEIVAKCDAIAFCDTRKGSLVPYRAPLPMPDKLGNYSRRTIKDSVVNNDRCSLLWVGYGEGINRYCWVSRFPVQPNLRICNCRGKGTSPDGLGNPTLVSIYRTPTKNSVSRITYHVLLENDCFTGAAVVAG